MVFYFDEEGRKTCIGGSHGLSRTFLEDIA